MTNLHFEVGDLNKISDKQKFDLVISLSTLHYFQNPIKKIKELLNVVNNGGSLIINYPNKRLLNIHRKGKDIDYWASRFNLMFKEKNLITLSQIKQLGYRYIVIRETKPENRYVQILKGL